METLLKLTKVWYDKEAEQVCEKPILVGVESIIGVESSGCRYMGGFVLKYTNIESRGAMVTTFNVKESVEEIYQMYKSQTL